MRHFAQLPLPSPCPLQPDRFAKLANLAPQIATKIAPLMASGSAQLEDALVKAQLQGEAGDIQKRIEAAIQAQLTIQTQQAKTLERIRQVIAADPGLAVLGNNN